jgi:hypothetical protein
LLLALASSVGSSYLTLGQGLHLETCPLCCYQRCFMLAITGVLLLGLITGAGKPISLSLLALPLAIAGLGVAGYQIVLEKRGLLECPLGLFRLGTAPQQSLAAFLALTVMLLLDVQARPGLGRAIKLGGILAGLILGAGFAASCIQEDRMASARVPNPTRPYPSGEITRCRIPYKEKAK